VRGWQRGGGGGGQLVGGGGSLAEARLRWQQQRVGKRSCRRCCCCRRQTPATATMLPKRRVIFLTGKAIPLRGLLARSRLFLRLVMARKLQHPACWNYSWSGLHRRLPTVRRLHHRLPPDRWQRQSPGLDRSWLRAGGQRRREVEWRQLRRRLRQRQWRWGRRLRRRG
jgi:hypothetical protein